MIAKYILVPIILTPQVPNLKYLAQGLILLPVSLSSELESLMPVKDICARADEDVPYVDCGYRIDRNEAIIYNTDITHSHFVVAITNGTADSDDYLHPVIVPTLNRGLPKALLHSLTENVSTHKSATLCVSTS
jgi:hypothetical protein